MILKAATRRKGRRKVRKRRSSNCPVCSHTLVPQLKRLFARKVSEQRVHDGLFLYSSCPLEKLWLHTQAMRRRCARSFCLSVLHHKCDDVTAVYLNTPEFHILMYRNCTLKTENLFWIVSLVSWRLYTPMISWHKFLYMASLSQIHVELPTHRTAQSA